MTDLVKMVKEKMGYVTSHNSCKNCKHFSEDMTTDNFGSGDTCKRNPDIIFRTNTSAWCNGWSAK